jgi:Lectin C-type domain
MFAQQYTVTPMLKNIIASVLMISASLALNAQTVPGLPKDAESLRKSYQEARQRALQPLDVKYKTELEKLLATHTKAGHLDDAIAIRAELAGIGSVTAGGTASAPTAEPSVETADGDLLRGGHRYRFIHTLATWPEADEHCKKLGGHLVSVGSKSEWDALLKYSAKNNQGTNWWIGLHRPPGQLEPLTWTDDTKYDFKGGWSASSLSDTTRPYVLVVIASNLWTCYQEGIKGYYICEWDKP